MTPTWAICRECQRDTQAIVALGVAHELLAAGVVLLHTQPTGEPGAVWLDGHGWMMCRCGAQRVPIAVYRWHETMIDFWARKSQS